jgi:arsenate reductase
MKEIDIDISGHKPKPVDLFLSRPFDYVITVCDHARETCPLFTGNVSRRLHLGFEDPAEAVGSQEEVMAAFRRVRDEIKKQFQKFYVDNIQKAG